MTNIDPDIINDEQLRRLLTLRRSPLATFVPRTNRPEHFDEQQSFVESKAKVSVCLGGNGSGKSFSSAYKAARFLLIDQPPPRRDTPYIVISDSIDQVGKVGWKQGLEHFIPPEMIDWPRVRWESAKLNYPSELPLKPWPGTGCNWTVEFKSAESGRSKFAGTSIGGFWISEPIELPLVNEIIRGTREHDFDGSGIIEQTPVHPEMSLWLEEMQADPPDGWAFFRLNSELNSEISDRHRRMFLATVSEEMRETRRTGAFPSYRGAVYQNFNPKIHVVDDDVIFSNNGKFPIGVWHRRGLDWGESAEHPFAVVWGYRDGSGNWFVYDEFLDADCIEYEHRAEIVRERWPWNDEYHGITYADPSRPMMIGSFCRWGISTGAATNAVHDGIETVRRLLTVNETTGKPSIYIHKNCINLIKQLRKYRWLQSTGRGLNPNRARPEILKRDDDLCDAMRYLLHSERVLHVESPTSDHRVGCRLGHRIINTQFGDGTFRDRWISGIGIVAPGRPDRTNNN